MEESINWPDPDDQETFEKQLLEQLKTKNNENNKSFIKNHNQSEW